MNPVPGAEYFANNKIPGRARSLTEAAKRSTATMQ